MKTFKKFKIESYDKKLFDKYNIQKQNKYNYFGDLKNIDKSDVMKFLGEIGDNTNEMNNKVFQYIIKVIKQMLSNHDLDNFWLTIRSMLPTDNFKNLRWHIDGLYYKSNRIQFKIVCVPKGDVTLFIEPNEENRKKFIELQTKQNKEYNSNFSNFNEVNKKYGKIYNELFNDEKIVRLKNNYYVEFNVRDQEIAAIHSEPDMKIPRLFFSVLPGTKAEIEELKNKKTIG